MEMEGKSVLSSCDSTVTQYWLCILRELKQLISLTSTVAVMLLSYVLPESKVRSL